MNGLIQVNTDLCNTCGLCVRACPAGVLSMSKNGPINLVDECINCGHCVAVCPSEALNHRQAPLDKQVACRQDLAITPDQAAEFLFSRRSIRGFTSKPVERNVLEKMLDISRFAPSGGNTQGISFLVINDKSVLQQVTELCVTYMDEWFITAEDTPMKQKLHFMLQRYHQSGHDVILCGAPCLVVSMAQPANRNKRDSSVMYLLYTQLYGRVLGLASCWAGLVEYAFAAGYRPLLELLDIPESLVPTGAMMVGYPAYTHKRHPARNPIQIVWQQG